MAMTVQDLEAMLESGTKKGTSGVRTAGQNRVGAVRGGRAEARSSQRMQNEVKAQLAGTQKTPASPLNMLMDTTRVSQIRYCALVDCSSHPVRPGVSAFASRMWLDKCREHLMC